jgi:hypothetical protein
MTIIQTPAERALHLQGLLATKPTALTRYIRTCIPWQMVRFVRINLKMFRVIFKSH